MDWNGLNWHVTEAMLIMQLKRTSGPLQAGS